MKETTNGRLESLRQNTVGELTHVKIRPYNIKQLCAIYDISRACFEGWVKPFKKKIGPQRGGYFTPLQVEMIFRLCGAPKNAFI
ncbi:MAG: hypothetical protein JWQ27_2983 [Ferruginibacter sp.]|nr:hypothetical protein [Ferruginibacter sp.]